MEPHGDRNDTPPLASATVIMLRDAPGGIEVFLIRRHGLSDVLGGAHVFPGGKVDREDVQLAARLDQPMEALHAALGEAQLSPGQAAALHVAAIREVFEETGVLYAGVDESLAREAWELMREGRRFDEVVDALDLGLTTAGLAPWSRWITPLVGGVVRKRFDTRFFVAAAPPGQEPVHDEHEATESIWLRPRDALEQYWGGAIQLAPPQLMSLAHLSRLASVNEVLAEARRRPPARICPESFEQDGTRAVCYPGDPRHSEKVRVMPGPTCLLWRNDRFEPPDGGLEAFFA
ncbi:MAG: NUDIX hydrolase [Burkholderiales bacterium]|nr:NUDIX hydrolase [Burkholderiales bacterium]